VTLVPSPPLPRSGAQCQSPTDETEKSALNEDQPEESDNN
jgi:hypothetical protein